MFNDDYSRIRLMPFYANRLHRKYALKPLVVTMMLRHFKDA